jgi:oligoribonuclease (3'-5' exoribonuclease)
MVWVDVETGGLGEHTPLLEIAVVITDSDLNEIATFDRVLRSDADELIEVHPAAAVMHAKSRLFEDYAAATPVPWWGHEDALLGFLLRHEATGLPMAGSSVHFDLPAAPRGNKAHRALADIRQSISELAFYRSHWALDELADR